jgi:pimeloyl-ACP methyl ester carboxylesterase
MQLAITEFAPDGPTEAAPLIVVPGLFGSARNWRAHAKRMGPGRRVIAVDMRNHGASPWSDVHDYPAMAEDLAELIADVGGEAAVLGHSMGGKAAMVLAQTRPEMIEALIVADIAPVAYDHDLLTEIEAMLAVDLAPLTRRSEVEAALEAHLKIPAVRSFLAQSAVLDDAPHWSLNLMALKANMRAITGFPELPGQYDGPVLFLSGGTSDYVQDLHHPRIRQMFPNVVFEVLEGAGHWLHAEQPRGFVDAVNGFLETGL